MVTYLSRNNIVIVLFLFHTFISRPVYSQTPEQTAAIQAMWWASKTAWEAHLKDEIHQLFVCKSSEPALDKSPCNYLVGHMLSDVYHINDFDTPDGFLSADQMITSVYSSGSQWKEIGSAMAQENLKAAQDKANDGYAVIALYPSINGDPGHVALVLPGKLSHSTTWNMDVPNSASFFIGKPQDSYVGRGLSAAFATQKKGDVRIFYRLGSNIHI